VVTVSRRPGAGANVLVGADVLARHGVERHETDRGGDVTYHGPGQLVAYPIVDLDVVGVRIHGWIRLLEQSIIDTLAELGIQAGRDPGATGVWVGRDPGTPDGFGGRKIAAIGVRVSRWVTMHGLALNVDPDLSHFGLIVPCGLAGRPVTSIAKELGTAPEMAEVKRRLAANVSSNLQAPPV
jgi:lipoyl(octanoyl) transferase